MLLRTTDVPAPHSEGPAGAAGLREGSKSKVSKWVEGNCHGEIQFQDLSTSTTSKFGVWASTCVCVCVCVCALSTYVKVFWLTLEKTISTVKLIHGRSLDEFECLCLHWVYFRDLWCTVNCLVWMLFESLYYVHSGDQCNWACWTIVLPCRAVASACAKVAVPCVECIKPVA